LSALAEEPRFTAAEWSRIVSDPTKDNAYQQITRLGGAVAKYLAWKRLSASARTLEIYESYLAALCLYLTTDHDDPAIDEVTADMLLAAAERHPIGSYKLVRTTYREFFAWAEEWELVARSPARRLPRSLHQPVRVYDVFTLAEQQRLVKAADELPLPWVQRLRVRALVDLGIRSKEARYLRVDDIDIGDRVAIVRAGGAKGGKERIVPFGDEFYRAFMAFSNRPIPAVRMRDRQGVYREERLPSAADFLFFPLGFLRSTRKVTWTDPGRQFSDRAIRSWWNQVIAASGVRYRSLHMCRHTLATNLSDAGEGIETIGEWLGHADPKTTKVYVHNSRSRLQKGRSALDAYRKARGA
jgi:integrase/recombinase XerD